LLNIIDHIHLCLLLFFRYYNLLNIRNFQWYNYCLFKVSVESGDNFDDDDNDDEKAHLNKSYVREKKIKVKNFSKNSKKDDDTIKIKNVKIEKNSEEEE